MKDEYGHQDCIKKALTKIRDSKGEISKLTIKERCAVLWVCFSRFHRYKSANTATSTELLAAAITECPDFNASHALERVWLAGNEDFFDNAGFEPNEDVVDSEGFEPDEC